MIVGSVLGSVVGSLLLLFAFICCLRQRQRRQPQRSRRPEPPTSQVMWMWHDVHGSDDEQDADLDTQLRSPGDASPQTSGDENDAFLRPSGEAYYDARETTSSPRLVDAPPTSRDSSGPIGVALDQGSKASVPSTGRRHIISREQLAELSRDLPPIPDSSRSPEEGDLGPDSPLLPPPRVNVSHGSRRSLLPSERSMTPGNDPESALLYTAQRVQVGGRSTPSSPETPWAEGIGVPSILRRSWLNPRTRSATPTTSSLKSSFLGRQLTDNELEAGRNHSAQMRSEMGYREGARPISSVSAMSTTSGNTLFYDAQSREDLSTPPPVPPLPPLPLGTASTGRSGLPGPSPLSAEPIRASHDSEKPPSYDSPPEIREPDDAIDYLDVPIPRPASPFASVSSANRISPPPGLGVPDSTPEAAHSSDLGDAINIELLEEDPPTAGESWRQISLGLPSLHERRTTFGPMVRVPFLLLFVGLCSTPICLPKPSTIVYPPEQTVSEHGSLHSMRSHFGAHSPLSASGSAPASNSNSGHSRGFTAASSLRSLAHSSSISSVDRRFARHGPGEVSPPLSATGRRTATSVSPPPRAAFSGNLSPTLLPPPAAAAPHHVQNATVTSTATRSSVTTHTSMTDPITGEVVRYPHPTWTGGREHALEEGSGSDGVRPPPLSA